MINANKFIDTLLKENIQFYTGVPDSYLNGVCNCLLERISKEKHIIAANEGNAVGIAAGYYLATQKPPLVYMQNSGMGNALNPLLSLADKDVYHIPMILLIGWRGEPGTDDHPQHKKQGEITLKLLEDLNIPYIIAEDDDEKFQQQLLQIITTMKTTHLPVAIVGRKGIFAETDKKNIVDSTYPMSREDAIRTILDTMPKETIYIATTGRATRELYFERERRGESHEYDFLNVGSMGHASSVALGIALSKQDRYVVCLDGDSAAMMHMGAFTMASKYNVPNLIHIILNNGAHESVGGQPSAGHLVDFTKIAVACGYNTPGHSIESEDQLKKSLKDMQSSDKTSFLDVRIHKGLSRKLPPLDICPYNLSKELISNLNK